MTDQPIPTRCQYPQAVRAEHPPCKGQGCDACWDTGADPSGPTCRCRHPLGVHVRGECIAIRGGGWDFCPCEQLMSGEILAAEDVPGGVGQEA